VYPEVLFARRVLSAAAASLLVLLTGCGGGGGGGATGGAADVATAAVSSAAVNATSLFPAAQSLANQCSADGQKRWVRSHVDEVYLWHDEVREVDAARHANASSYFEALMVRGPARDHFSRAMAVVAANEMENAALAAAEPAGVSTALATNPVPLVRTLQTAGGRKVGYVLFNVHSHGAQDALIAAFEGLRAGGIQDLVLDLRYNPGGFLYVAQTIAAMVAGPRADGQVFERLQYNRKRHGDTARNTLYFSGQVQTAENVYPQGAELPRLSLPRLYVLTSGLTCSASESIVNGLRGVGVQVVLVGERTCGKPYGFHRKDNCGIAYYPIEFHVTNAAGFGDYAGGFPVQCPVAENPRTPLGAANEPLLAAAMRHVDTGNCPVTASAAAAGVVVEASATANPSPLERLGVPAASSPMYQPAFNGRRLLP
jgi:hypothetical protein